MVPHSPQAPVVGHIVKYSNSLNDFPYLILFTVISPNETRALLFTSCCFVSLSWGVHIICFHHICSILIFPEILMEFLLNAALLIPFIFEFLNQNGPLFNIIRNLCTVFLQFAILTEWNIFFFHLER